MQFRGAFLTVCQLIFCLGYLNAAPFQNLNFEATALVPDGMGLLPGNASVEDVLPHWELYIEANNFSMPLSVCPDCGSDEFTSFHIGYPWDVALVNQAFLDAFHPSTDMIEGNYSLALNSGIEPEISIPVIAQTGDVPANAKSIGIVSARTYDYYEGAGLIPIIRFNKHQVQLIDMGYDSSAGGYVLMGNIEPIAGLTRTMKIGPKINVSGGTPHPSEPGWFQDTFNGVFIDNIFFSTQAVAGPPVAVPEPGTSVIIAGFLAGLYQRRWI